MSSAHQTKPMNAEVLGTKAYLCSEIGQVAARWADTLGDLEAVIDQSFRPSSGQWSLFCRAHDRICARRRGLSGVA